VLGSTQEQRSNRRLLWSGAPDCPVCHRTCPVHQGTPTPNCSPSGISGDHSAKIHRTVWCTPDMSGAHRTCPVLQGRAASRTRQPRVFTSAAPLKFTGLSGVHRTVRCNLGATATSRQRSPAGAFNALQKRAVVRHAGAGAPDTLQCMSGVPPDIKAGPEVRSSNGRNPTELVTWLGHRTVRCAPDCPVCTGLSGAPSNRPPPPTVMFGGWGYKYPNHPTIHCIQVFTFQPPYKS
jgi:hypothetical protein